MNTPASKPDPKADAALQEARQMFEKGRLDDALRALDVSISHQPTAFAWRMKGFIYKQTGRTKEAVKALETSLEINPQEHGSLSLLAEIHFAQNDIAKAIGFYVLAIGADPSVRGYKNNFLLLGGRTPFVQYNPQTAAALVACLQTPDIECGGAQIMWLSLFERSPGVDKLYKSRMGGVAPVFDPSGFTPDVDLAALDTPLFIEGLSRIAIHYPVFDQFLTHLRRHLLLNVGVDKASTLHTRLAAALGHYCFFTEYIFDIGAQEKAAVAELHTRIKNNNNVTPAVLALYSCYAPLAALEAPATAEHILQTSTETVLQSLATVQIAEPLALEADKKNIAALTPIDNDVSQKVRAQYEEFPYPRWKQLSGTKIDADMAQRLAGKKARILVAGCGTGREALNAAAQFPDAEVLAVDLSLTSLAYARSRAALHGIKNVDFRHGDILKLGALSERFDYITSSGVLHHLGNPEEGFAVLAGLLKPQGLMRFALYSELGRKAVVAAREAIQKGGYKDDAEDMRRFRNDIPKLLSGMEYLDLVSFGDFYHLSMFRDLLFHVQEHRFDPPRIQRALDANGMTFLRMDVDKNAEALYRKAYGSAPHTLVNWYEVEKKNPALFRTMYVVWAQGK